jgi:tripartite-type tricarboxylate transporter receptor subunit TctC
MTSLTRRTVLGAALALQTLSPSTWAAESAWPTKPVRLIVLYTPGGASDIIARTIGQRLTDIWGQPVVVENRAGGNGFIGLDVAAHAQPDGYTIVLGAAPLVVSPALFKSFPFDPVKDFAPITLIARTLNVLVAEKSFPANNAAEFFALAKKAPPETYSYASASPLFTLASELMAHDAGIRLQRIPYKGVAEALTDVMGGRVSMMVDTVGAQMPQIKSGRVKALAVLSKTRHPNLPNVPTLAESGLPGYDEEGWVGLLAPTGTPADVIAKINRDAGAVMQLPEVQARLNGLGFVTAVSTPAELAERIKTDIARYVRVANEAHIPKE